MAKKKRIVINSEPVIVYNDLKKVYIYKRHWKLLTPVPFYWKLDIKKIQEFKQ